MKRSVLSLTLVLLATLPTGCAHTARRPTADPQVDPQSISGPGRKIMRLSDGRLFASFDVLREGSGTASLLAARGVGAALTDVSGPLSGIHARSIASDTGPAGTYVAFVDAASGAGALARFADPLGTLDAVEVFSDLTPAGAADTFIAASKGDDTTNSVAYAWRSDEGKTIAVGVSPDGESFTDARTVVQDAHLTSGPSLAVHNDYILLTYLTRNPAFLPAQAAADRGYPAWLESWDGGKTWTAPAALFGSAIGDFPKAEEAVRVEERSSAEPLFAAGGARVAGNSLAWAEDVIGARIFITTEQGLVTREGRQPGEARPTVGVVSFKDLSDGPEARWQSVIASEYIQHVTDPDRGRRTNFQYSALPGSSIRAVAYLEEGARDGGAITVSVSLNTGRSFDRFVKVDSARLGLKSGDPLHFTTSTCLLVRSGGDVYLDIAYLEPQSNRVQLAQVPLEVNVGDLPPSLFNHFARWP